MVTVADLSRFNLDLSLKFSYVNWCAVVDDNCAGGGEGSLETWNLPVKTNSTGKKFRHSAGSRPQ
jgi:hypothetical protein